MRHPRGVRAERHAGPRLIVRRDMEEYGIDLKVLARDRIQHKFYTVPAYSVTAEDLLVARQPDLP